MIEVIRRRLVEKLLRALKAIGDRKAIEDRPQLMLA